MKTRILLFLIVALTFASCGSTAKHHARVAPPAPKHYTHEYSAAELVKHPPSVNALPPRKGLAHLGHRFSAVGRPPIPTSPLGPSGSFRLVAGDAFARPIGSGAGMDPTFKANNHDQGCCNNGDEWAAEREAEVRMSAAGAEINCDHIANAGKSYTCGGIDSDTPLGFKAEFAPGITFVFQTRMKLPPAKNCGEDPGDWASDPQWRDEIDFFEGWGWNPRCVYSGGTVWIYVTPSSSIRLQCLPWEGCGTWIPSPSNPGAPDAEFHTYTTVVHGISSFDEYIDGKLRGSVSGANAAQPWEHLIFTHALRVSNSTPPSFTSTSTFYIDYTAVYESGEGHTQNAHLAPGTVEAGGTEPPPTTTEKTTPTPTETTPPPPPPPPTLAVPTGCKAEGFLEGSTAKTRASCNTPPTGVSIEWQRTGPWTCSAGATPRYPIWTTGNPISNACAVERGKRYDWSARAHNSTGTSAWTTPMPAYTP